MKYIITITLLFALLGRVSAQTKHTEIVRVQLGAFSITEHKNIKTGEIDYSFLARNINYKNIVDFIVVPFGSTLEDIKNNLIEVRKFYLANEIDVSSKVSNMYVAKTKYYGMTMIYLSPLDRNDAHTYLNEKTIKKLVSKIEAYQNK